MDADKVQEARTQLQKVAKLELRLVHPESDSLIPRIEAGEGRIPPGYRVENIVEGEDGVIRGKLLVRSKADIDGSEVRGGRPFFDQSGQWGVSIEFNAKGAEQF